MNWMQARVALPSYTQSPPLSNPQSSPPSNNHNGDNNHGNNGYIGDGDGNVVVSNSKDCQINIGVKGKNELDELLYSDISDDALHYSEGAPTKCHPGTRKTSRNAIGEWMLDPAGSPLLWLHGPAGVGKSTIAKTISTIPPNQIRVVATFFFSTCSDKSATKLFATLAWQLAKNVPETEEHIVAALKRDRSLTKRELDHQFDQLIVQPLKKCTSTETSALLMVIDGVDECVDENKQIEFLNILKRAGAKGDLPLRFLICSRPERRICNILETTDDDYATAKSQATSSPNSDVSQSPTAGRLPQPGQSENPINSAQEQPSLSLGDQVRIEVGPYLSMVMAQLTSLRRWRPGRPTVLPSDAWMLFQPIQLGADKGHNEIDDELDKVRHRKVISRIKIGLSEESKEDVKKYLMDKFKEIRSPDSINSEAIDELVKKSCGHFLYASIIVNLLDRSGFSLDAVLKMAQSSALPSPDLDKLYSAILDKAKKLMRDEPGISAKTDLVTLKDVFAILVVLWENVQLADIRESYPIIESLLVLEKAELERILRKMHSILDINPGKSIRVYHRSFFEFLQDRDRSKCHCIPYSFALQRYLFLLSRVVVKYAFRRCFSQLQYASDKYQPSSTDKNLNRDNDKEQAERIRDMVLAFPRNFFRRSTNPTKLATFHVRVHTVIVLLLWTSIFWLGLDFWDDLIIPRVPPMCVFFARYILIMVLFIIVGSFIPLLMCYISYVRRSIIRYPLFHPFLHPFLVNTSDFLLSSV